jgi:N-acetylglucosamine-6-sulfatase
MLRVMERRQFLQAGMALGAVTTAMPAVQTARAKRSLVFILSDDHRYDSLGSAGHPWLKTPYMDRMIQNGVLFENAFVTTSLCSPSRASCLSGQYTHCHQVTGNQVDMPEGTPTFPELLQKEGYRTGFFGKWHMGSQRDDPRPGFDEWLSFRGQGDYNDPTLNHNGVRRKTPGYVTDLLTEATNRFIRESRDRPFCAYLSHKAVHAHFFPAKRHEHLYHTEPIPMPDTFADTEENYRGKPEWVRKQRNSWHGVDGMYNHAVGLEELYRGYCRCLTSLDESIGAVINQLEELGLAEDTLVIYASDNGFMFGDFGLIDKRVQYEPSMRIPMFAQCPSLFGKGRKVQGMALNIDVAPTLVAAAGLPVPDSMHGRSLLELIAASERGDLSGWRKDFVYEYFWEAAYPSTPTCIGLRTDEYSYMNYQGVWDRDELYNIRSDPQQRNNLIADYRTTTEGGENLVRIRQQTPELYQLVAGFRERIDAIMAATGGRRLPTWKA